VAVEAIEGGTDDLGKGVSIPIRFLKNKHIPSYLWDLKSNLRNVDVGKSEENFA